jgi:hypothetical protein
METYGQKCERMLAAIEFKPLDRLPVIGGNGTIAALQAVTGRTDYATNAKAVFTAAMQRWNVDIVRQFVLPDRQDRRIGPNAEVDTANGLHTVIYRFLRAWNAEHGPIASPEAFRDFCASLPPADRASSYVDQSVTAQRWLELDAWGDFLKPIVWIPGHLCGKVGWMWYSQVGYENFLMAHLLYPEAVERLFAFEGEEARHRNVAIAQTIRAHGLLPIVYCGEDICGNSGPLCSPAVLREIYFPHLKRAAEPLIDAGIHWLWHSDGDIMPIVPDLMDCGIDGYQGFEEDKGMDLYALAQTPCRNGSLPFLAGSVSVNSTMYQTPAAIRADIGRMVELARQRGGGVLLGTSSSMMENMPVENVLAFYEAALHPEINVMA